MVETDNPTLLCAVAEDTPVRVVETARWLATELDGRVVLAHAFDAMAIQVPASRELVYADLTADNLAQAERARADGMLGVAARTLADVPHKAVLGDGLPVPVLLALAAEHQARLLVAGSATHGAVDRILLGSVSSELASKAPCPVVVVPDDATLAAPGPVVAGYDGSRDSLHAAGHAAELAEQLERELVLVHVAQPGAEPERLDPGITTVHGDPAERLVETARERSAALLVVGTRGRGPVTSALLGSVSAGVVARAARPVVLVGPAAASASDVSRAT